MTRDGWIADKVHGVGSSDVDVEWLSTRADRFTSRYEVAESGCWLWRGTMDPVTGYGRLSVRRRSVGAHRVSYLINAGLIPDGMSILHACDVRLCVNPAHLYAGTQADNMRDAVERGRMASGDRHKSRLYPDQRPRGDTHGLRKNPGTAASGDRHGTRTRPDSLRRGEGKPEAKLTDTGVREIRRRHAAGESYASISRDYGVSSTVVRLANLRRTWAHVE